MDDTYVDLIAAIVKQAITDYKRALREENLKGIKECERFFLSEWGDMLTLDNGKEIIRRCREEVGIAEEVI